MYLSMVLVKFIILFFSFVQKSGMCNVLKMRLRRVNFYRQRGQGLGGALLFRRKR